LKEVQYENISYWYKAMQEYVIPYYPNVTVGWDSSPRAHQSDKFENIGYPFMGIMKSTPDKFEVALKKAKEVLNNYSENNR